jgi:hypothetical protein
MSVLGQGQAARVPVCQPWGSKLVLLACFAILLTGGFAPAAAKVRITGLSDVSFGTISNLTVDAVQSQSICVYSNGPAQSYSIRADGSGGGGAFTLSSGVATLGYEIRWNNQAGQSNGTALSAGSSLSGQTTNAQNQTCSTGPSATASLIVTLPATSISSATAGTYSGTLTIIVAEE